ncbi:hypothetical protein, partial [uncultured Campylobacter sp.]|uniref:hypothetical protein n=1 Tax=uncultured Campylobacter sp. TaxID=218934 RepID=UPI0026083363
RNCRADTKFVTLYSFLNPSSARSYEAKPEQNPSHVREACECAVAPHAVKKLKQILKLELAYHGSKFKRNFSAQNIRH